MTLHTNQELCIVGDIHGQFEDLMHIFRTIGFPTPSRPFLFNGDFVDRGSMSVEVLLTLYAWQQLHPGSVMLNRGNHEERSVNVRNGFENECVLKYPSDSEMHEKFVNTFAWLPLATIVNGRVFVVHGGVDENLTVEALEGAPRSEYQVSEGLRNNKRRGSLMHPAMIAQQAAAAERDAQLRPITSALWNDPMEEEGERPNDVRSIGVFFGPGVARDFLQRSRLHLVVRSHEQAEDGCAWPFGTGKLLVTVFSASNYSGKMQNRGAYALLGSAADVKPQGSADGGSTSADGAAAAAAEGALEEDSDKPPTPMWTVKGVSSHDGIADGMRRGSTAMPTPLWKVSGDSEAPAAASSSQEMTEAPPEEGEEGPEVECVEQREDGSFHYSFGRLRFVRYEARELSETRVQQRVVHRLQALVLAHREPLQKAYEEADSAKSGSLPVAEWAELTQKVLEVTVPLMQLRGHLLGAEAARSSSGAVDYRAYLARHQLVNPTLEPLYRVHEFLLASMYRAETLCRGESDRPAEGEGMLPVHVFERCCRLMSERFGDKVCSPPHRAPPSPTRWPRPTAHRCSRLRPPSEQAALCKDAHTLLGAMGEMGAEAIKTGQVSISRVAEQFDLVPQEGEHRPGLLTLLHRLNRNYIQALVKSGEEALVKSAHGTDEPKPGEAEQSSAPPSLAVEAEKLSNTSLAKLSASASGSSLDPNSSNC